MKCIFFTSCVWIKSLKPVPTIPLGLLQHSCFRVTEFSPRRWYTNCIIFFFLKRRYMAFSLYLVSDVTKGTVG